MSTEVQTDPREALVEEGLLSPALEIWREGYVAGHKPWFELARDLNRYGTWLFQEHQGAGHGGLANAQAPTAVRMYARALNAFAASVMLAERAMTIDAAGAARPIYEVGFWLSLLATNPVKAFEQLELDELKNGIDREKLLRMEYDGDTTIETASLAREAKLKAQLDKRKPESLKAIAETMPADSGYFHYKITSGFYGHLSNQSLDALKLQTGGGGVRPILGPFEDQIPKAVSFAIDAMLRVSRYFQVMMKEDRQPERLPGFHQRLRDLQIAAAPLNRPFEGSPQS